MSDIETQVEALLDYIGSKTVLPFHLTTIISQAEAQGIKFDAPFWEALTRTDNQKRWRTFYSPQLVADFISAYLDGSSPQSILDPCVGVGLILSSLIQRFAPKIAIGIEINRSTFNATIKLREGQNIEWRFGDALELLDGLQCEFDIVIGDPPIGTRINSLTLAGDTDPVELYDDVGSLLMLKACRLLKPEGIGFFVLSPRFLIARNAKSVYANLARLGLFIDAIITIPSAILSHQTSIDGLLVIIRRSHSPLLFVSELTQDQASTQTMLQNLKLRRDGKVPQLGALVDRDSFYSLHSLVANRELAALVNKFGQPALVLKDVAGAINLGSHNGADFTEEANAIYLPLIGRSPVVTSRSELKIKEQNYAQIILDPQKVQAVYVANFLNTSLGQKIRASLLSGVSIPKITKAALETASIYVPDLSVQSEVVRVNSNITDLTSQLDALRRQLWAYPRKAKEIGKEIAILNREDSIVSWMETLPFPLASILWAKHADSNNEHKVDHLLHFFEGYSQFIVAIIASALLRDSALIGNQRSQTESAKPPYSSFGVWNTYCRQYAKRARQLMENKDTREHCRELFGNPDFELFEMLTDKRIMGVLEEVKPYRDQWKGHGGICSAADMTNRLAILEDKLSTLRELVEDRYASMLLLSPSSSEFEDGIYHFQVNALMGTRTPFRTMSVDTLVPMDRRKLYVINQGQLQPLELLPLFRIMESPKTHQNACYFYNRFEGDQVRWVIMDPRIKTRNRSEIS